MDKRSPLEWATLYTHKGWKVIPVPFREKGPVISNWNTLTLTEDQLPNYFGGRTNIGVLLGEPSQGLIDVDLDHPLAVELAAQFLPPTESVFGRAGKPRSHWLYCSTAQVATKQWKIPSGPTIVELRSTGGQTVFPGSVHPSGESIAWDTDGEPAVVHPMALTKQIQALHDEVLIQLDLPMPQNRLTRAGDFGQVPPTVLQRARKYLAKIPPAISGQGGHAATFHAACILVIGFGLDRGQALTLLAEWNEHCQPSWSESELEHKVDDALKQPGWRGYLIHRSPAKSIRGPLDAIDRANRHAIEHRLKQRRRTHA